MLVKRLGLFLSTLLILVTIFGTFFTNNRVSAQSLDWNDLETNLRLEVISAFIFRCGTLHSSVRADTVARGHFIGDDRRGTSVHLSRFAANAGTGGIQGGNCTALASKVTTILFDGDRGFMEYFFDLDQSSNTWNRKGEFSNNSVYVAELRRLASERGYWQPQGSSYVPRRPYMYRWQVLRHPFSRCFEPTTNSGLFALTHEGKTVNYQYNANARPSDDKYPIGYVIANWRWGVTDFAGGAPQASCEELMETIRANPESFELLMYDQSGLSEALGITVSAPPDDGGDEDDIVGDCEFGKTNHGWKIWETIGSVGENALNWFGCTVIKGVMTFIEFLNNSIDDYLRTDIDNFRDADSGIRQVWSSMLTIANILFVMAFLVMVIATALNLGIVDAYTVKKALPRLVIAAILANLSYSLVLVAIDITNTLGGAVKDIILQPVGGDAALRTAFSGVQETNALGVVGLGTGIAVGFGLSALATGGIFVLIPLLLTLAFGILVAWGVIMVRTIVILLLVVLSPIAIAFWALPGLESLEKRWWKMLVQMLMVYPYIMGFIAAGQFVAILIARSSGASTNTPISADNPPDVGIGNAIAIIAVIVLPYILLPTVFKLATSTIGNITGMMNNKGKGIFDRGSNAARERAKTTKKAQGKEFSKQFKTAERGSLGKRGQMADMQKNLSRNGMRGRWARRSNWAGGGLNDESAAMLESQLKEENFRRGTAQEKARKTGLQAASFALDEEMSRNGVGSKGEQTDFLKERALDTSRSLEERQAAMAGVIARGGVSEFDEIQKTYVGRGSEGIAELNQFTTDNLDLIKSKSAGHAHTISANEVGKMVEGGMSVNGALTQLNTKAMAGSKPEVFATQSKKTWQALSSSSPEGTARAMDLFAEIEGNENLRGSLDPQAAVGIASGGHVDKLTDDQLLRLHSSLESAARTITPSDTNTKDAHQNAMNAVESVMNSRTTP